MTSHLQQIRQRSAELLRANEALAVEIRRASESRSSGRARPSGRCNHVLIRAGDEPQFLRELCRVIVEVAGYRLLLGRLC